MTYDEAVAQYAMARDQLQRIADTGGYGSAAVVTSLENQMAQAAHVIAAAVVDGQAR